MLEPEEIVSTALAVELRGTLTKEGLIEAAGSCRKREAVETEVVRNTLGSSLGQLVTAEGRLIVMMMSEVAPRLRVTLLTDGVMEKFGKTHRPCAVAEGTLANKPATAMESRAISH